MIHVVLDTNTIISGIFWPGAPRLVYEAGFHEIYQIYSSDGLFAELNDVLRRTKFSPALTALGKSADELLAEWRRAAEFVVPAEIPTDAVRDPKDRIVLACAVGGNADYIVSGDKDLLALAVYEAIPILSASAFLKHLTDEITL